MITQQELKQILDYNPETGNVIWIAKISDKINIGQKAGSFDSKGYQQIKIYGKIYRLHRIIWLYVYGVLPKNHIDHINGNRSDNRIENLRDIEERDNHQNLKKHRNGYLIGASYHSRIKRYLSFTTLNKKQFYIGCYKTEQESHEAYKSMNWLIEEVNKL